VCEQGRWVGFNGGCNPPVPLPDAGPDADDAATDVSDASADVHDGAPDGEGQDGGPD
jgi:hypothetical protein